MNFTPKNYTRKLNFEKKKISIRERGLRFGRNDHFGMSDGICFFLWKKRWSQFFFAVELTGDYRDVAIIPTLFRDHGQKSKKPIFSSFFQILTVIRK